MQMVRDLADRIHVPHHCGCWRAGGRVEGLRNLESFRSRGVKNGRTGSAESPVLAVRLEGANHQWRKIPPGELSIDPEADERFLLGDRLSWSLVTKVALGG